MSFIYNLLSYIVLLLVIVFLVLTFKKKMPFFTGVFSTAATFVASFILSVFAANAQTGGNIIDTIINQQFDQVIQSFQSLTPDMLQSIYGGNLTPADLETIKSQFAVAAQTLKDLYVIVFPAVIILTTLALSFLLFMLVKTVIRIFRKDVSAYPDFVALRMPKSATIVLGVTMVLSLIVSGAVGNAFLNIAIIMIGVAMVCGLAFILYMVKTLSKSIATRIFGYLAVLLVLSLFYTFSTYILGFAAILDSFLNLRTRMIKGDIHEQK